MWRSAALLALLALASANSDCSRNGYESCVRIADPLVKEAHLIFPDNMDDIDLVCRTWSRFVDCLKVYTDNCFTEQQRRQFNKAVENPIESVHQMCMQPNYQKEYLQYAPCIKNTITQQIHCGSHYNLLVDQVSQGEIISKSTLCCSHDRFKQCVQRETRRLCDSGTAEGPASRFSSQIIDKALSFLQDQCYNYIPNSGDCTTMTTDSEPAVFATSSSEVYPWSTIQDTVEAKDILPSRVTPPKMATTMSWMPSSSLPVQSSAVSPSDVLGLGPRRRPASYGRASTWSDSPSSTVGNTGQIYPELTSPSTSSSRPAWATVSWQSQVGGVNTDRPTTWYPAAGDQLGNDVDEPNQQGWIKQRNNACSIVQNTKSLFYAQTIIIFAEVFRRHILS